MDLGIWDCQAKWNQPLRRGFRHDGGRIRKEPLYGFLPASRAFPVGFISGGWAAARTVEPRQEGDYAEERSDRDEQN